MVTNSFDNYSTTCKDSTLNIAIEFKIALLMSYSLVAICSLVGNISVLLVVVMRSEMQTVTNLFIGSVSAADILITAVSLWSTPLSYYQTVWKFGPFMCYAVYAVQGASLMWSPLTLAAIAIDRCLLVSSPFKKQINSRTCLFIICGIWLGALLVLTPMLVHVHYFDVNECYQYCVEIWPDEGVVRLLYGLTVLTIRSAVPLAIISFCHWRIACILNEQTARLQTMRSTTTLRRAVDIRKKQRLQTLLLVMVIIFGVSSFPLDLFNVIQDMELAYRTELFPQQLKQVVFLVTHWFAMAGTLCNPLVYAWWSDNFRKETQRMISDFRKRFRLRHPRDAFAASQTSAPRTPRRYTTVTNETKNVLRNGDEGLVEKLMLRTTLEVSSLECTPSFK